MSHVKIAIRMADARPSRSWRPDDDLTSYIHQSLAISIQSLQKSSWPTSCQQSRHHSRNPSLGRCLVRAPFSAGGDRKSAPMDIGKMSRQRGQRTAEVSDSVLRDILHQPLPLRHRPSGTSRGETSRRGGRGEGQHRHRPVRHTRLAHQCSPPHGIGIFPTLSVCLPLSRVRS
jgi:hypothetical protein